VPSDMSFSCTEGAKITHTATNASKCTVTADKGYTCDTKETKLVCSDSKATEFNRPNFVNQVPDKVLCVTVGHKVGQADNDNSSTLSWMPVPKCTSTAATTAATVSGAPSTALFPATCLLMIIGSCLTIQYSSVF